MYVIPEFKGEWEFLSNFYEFPVDYASPAGTKTFPTNEHVFQAAKYKAMNAADPQAQVEYFERVRLAPTPAKAKYEGRSVRIDVTRWNSMRVEVMREIIKTKFQDPRMKRLLLSTGCAMLVEGNTWGDTFWGRCEGRGYNILGVLLMERRGVLGEA